MYIMQVGIFDATNSTRGRRNMLTEMAEGKCKVDFSNFLKVTFVEDYTVFNM